MAFTKISNFFSFGLFKHFRKKQLMKTYFIFYKDMSDVSAININNIGGLNIKKSIENLKIHHEIKFACLLIECLYCNNKKLYVNKITGKTLF